jgi:hypothetical protein
MDASLHFPDIYLKGDDFIGREVTLTIRAVVEETLHGTAGDEQKIVVYFVETKAKAERDGRPKNEKRVVLSKSLFVDLAGMFGKETKAWEKQRVTFFRGKAISGPKLVIRAKPAAAPSTAPSNEQTDNTEPTGTESNG